MISIERIRELIHLGNKNLNLDCKGAFSWNQADNDQKCEIARDVLAFSNTRDGGVILIGVNGKTGVLEGLTEEQYASFDQTTINDFIQKYTDPRHTVNVRRAFFDEKKVVIIDVPEFVDVPILCARDAYSSVNPSKLILRKAALYKRTERATSEPIEDAEGMRELLNRVLLRRQDELLRAFRQRQWPGAEFEAEIESANLYFSEVDNGALARSPHWAVQMQPETYLPNRIPTPSGLQNLVQTSAIRLRGWAFPIAGSVNAAPWANFEGGSQSFHKEHGDRSEALRVYKSGLVSWCSRIGEDYTRGPADRNSISFIGVIYSVTEWVLFARRFFERALSVDENVRLTVGAAGIKGRKLASEDPLLPLLGLEREFRTAVPEFEIKEIVTISDLRADPELIARRIIRRIFELFNWNDPDENMLRNWQQKLIQRQL